MNKEPNKMKFNPGFNVIPTFNPLGFEYGSECFGPVPELRYLNDIRKSLKEPKCSGPEIVYAIAMDIGENKHKGLLQSKMLLYGAVTFAAGRLGSEPIRSQGHIHKISSHSGWSPPEVYEIWIGKAVIYMQEFTQANPGKCFAVFAEEGDVVIVPPGWAHATISADPEHPLTFGAWCDREYGFEYDDVRALGGLAWFPILKERKISWQKNSKYNATSPVEKKPSSYSEFGLEKDIPIYSQFKKYTDRFLFVSEPGLKEKLWRKFIP